MSQRATALCVLMVDEILGDLASKVFHTLSAAGRLTLGGIITTSDLTPKQVKYSLAILVQHGLVLWHTSPNDGVTNYEASPKAAYHLLRLGKYEDLVGERFGKSASDLLLDLFLAGYVSLEDLEQTRRSNKEHTNGTGLARKFASPNGPNEEHSASADLEDTLGTLVYEHILTTCNPGFLRPASDNKLLAEQTANQRSATADGGKGLSKKDLQAIVRQTLQEWSLFDESCRKSAEIEIMRTFTSLSKKRPREVTEDDFVANPRKRVRFSEVEHRVNGGGANVNVEASNIRLPASNTAAKGRTSENDPLGSVSHKKVGPGPEKEQIHISSQNVSGLARENKLALRIDFDRLGVMARNDRLVRQVSDSLGDVTARVYSLILLLVESNMHLPRRGIASIDDDEQQHESAASVPVKTTEILDEWNKSTGLDLGAGLPDPASTAFHAPSRFARRLGASKGKSRPDSLDDVGEDLSSSEPGSDDEDDGVQAPSRVTQPTAATQPYSSSVTNGGISHTATQRDLLRQHLFMLAEHATPFLTYHTSPESWSVPYRALINALRLDALFSTIHARFDDSDDQVEGNRTAAVRVARMLSEKGKLDDKALANLSLINPKVLRARLASMHTAGAVGVQELPRDAQRSASRTLYLWFFDANRCAEKFAQDALQSITRLLQRLRHERALRRHLLEKADRSDVRGSEGEWLTKREMEQLTKWREFESRVWSQIARLDDMVALLKDY